MKRFDVTVNEVLIAEGHAAASEQERISARISIERKRLRISQTDCARACGVVRMSQVKYESTRTPDAVYLARFLGLGANVIYVLTGKS